MVICRMRCHGLPHGWAHGQVPQPVFGLESHEDQGRDAADATNAIDPDSFGIFENFCQFFCQLVVCRTLEALQHSQEFGSSVADKLQDLASSQAGLELLGSMCQRR